MEIQPQADQIQIIHPDNDVLVKELTAANVAKIASGDDVISTVTSVTVPEFLSKIETESVGSSITDTAGPRLILWDGTKMYSDLIRDGLRYLGKDDSNITMLFESPSTSSNETAFYNSQVFPIHDYPPADPIYRSALGPLRYSMMNGDTYSSYLQDAPPQLLLDHWVKTLPEFRMPTFTSTIEEDATVYAYLPLEHISKHVNDPFVHYHLAGKDALHLMTKHTPKYLANTKDSRPCIAKVTHSMGSKGIFVIENDEDEQELLDFLDTSGRPNYVVTDFVNIVRNISCHIFIHPCGDITWFGSSENYKDPVTGRWSMDSIILRDQQEELRQIQYPYVRQVADYSLSLGFWGFGGVDVLIDEHGQGHVVDFNPRTTGTCPALMARTQLSKHETDYPAGIFRRSTDFAFPGSANELMEQVEAYNAQGAGKVVLASMAEVSPNKTLINIGVFGTSLDECRAVINKFDPLL